MDNKEVKKEVKEKAEKVEKERVMATVKEKDKVKVKGTVKGTVKVKDRVKVKGMVKGTVKTIKARMEKAKVIKREEMQEANFPMIKRTK